MNADLRRPPVVRGLLAVAGLAARQALSQRGAWIGRALFLVLILIIFSRLWVAVEHAGALGGLRAGELLWYLALTEWVVIGLPLVHLTIEAEVRSGDLAALLPRPLPWLAVKVAEGLGSMLVRFLALGVAATGAALVLAGGLPPDPRGLLFTLPLVLLAGVLGTLINALVGLTAFWLVDASPAAWIVQKVGWVLGGMILPLSIYPGWLRDVAQVTPFPALLAGPARTAFGWDPAHALLTAAQLAGWIGALGLALAFGWSRARRRLDVGGG